MIQIAICDDEPAIVQKMKLKTEAIMNQMGTEYKIAGFLTADTFLATFSKRHFDIVEIDVELDKHQSGIELAKKINLLSPDTQIIFVTGYQKYYLDVYNADHVFLVEKNKMNEIMPKALKKAVDKIRDKNKQNTILLKYKGEIYAIKKSNILYIEKKLRIAEFHMKDQPDLDEYMNTDEVLNLLRDTDFIQIHRSYIVNMRHVTKISEQYLKLSSGISLPIGKAYLKEFQKKFILSHQNHDPAGI